MAVKNGVDKTWYVKPRLSDGKCHSDSPKGEEPVSGDYYVDFTALTANETRVSLGGLWTNSVDGTGGNAALASNRSMQIRVSTGGPRICCETGATNDYDDSLAFLPGYAGNQRVEATVYRAPGYAPSSTNHELEIHLGCVSFSGVNKRCVEIGFNYGGGYFIAGFNGDLVSWDAPPTGNMSSPWYSAATGSGSAPADGDVFRAELDRTAKTIKCWQNSTLVISLQWANTAQVTAAAQTVLNALGDGAGLGALRRIGADAVEGAFGWRNFRLSSTLLG